MSSARRLPSVRLLGAAAAPLFLATAAACSTGPESEACDLAFDGHDLAMDALYSAETELLDGYDPYTEDLEILFDYRDDMDYAADISGGDVSLLTLERADVIDDLLYSMESLDDVLYDEAVRDLDANTLRLEDACAGY